MNGRGIGYLLKKFPRLSETFVLGELLGQEQLGLEPVVISRRAPDDEPRHPELARLRAPVEVMPPTGELDPLTELLVAPGSEDLRLDRVRGLVQAMQRFDHPRLTRLVGEALYVRRLARRLDIEHLHVHFATDSAVVALLLRALGGPSYSLTAHAKDIYRETVDPALLSLLVERSEFTVTVCDANVRFLEGMLAPPALRKLRRLYNGIDLAAFRWNGGAREEDHLVSVGRLVPKKGFDVLIDAAARLCAGRPGLRFTIVGEGEERPRLEEQIRSLGLATNVELAGARDQEYVRQLLRRATLVCLACRIAPDGNRDALPTVLLEALASGLPAVSTPVTGIPEILDGGRVGSLVRADDPTELARAIASLLDAPARRAELARAGREHAERLFDSRKNARVLNEWLLGARDAAVVR